MVRKLPQSHRKWKFSKRLFVATFFLIENEKFCIFPLLNEKSFLFLNKVLLLFEILLRFFGWNGIMPKLFLSFRFLHISLAFAMTTVEKGEIFKILKRNFSTIFFLLFSPWNSSFHSFCFCFPKDSNTKIMEMIQLMGEKGWKVSMLRNRLQPGWIPLALEFKKNSGLKFKTIVRPGLQVWFTASSGFMSL